jgi:hypothetical protein
MKTRWAAIILLIATPTNVFFKAPPQLWRLETVKDTVRLALRHTYMPKVSVNFAGPSYFGGKDDELVFCAGKGSSDNSQYFPPSF